MHNKINEHADGYHILHFYCHMKLEDVALHNDNDDQLHSILDVKVIKAAIPLHNTTGKNANNGGNFNYRGKAANRSGDIGPTSPEVVNTLIASMKDDDIDIREAAAYALGKIGSASLEITTALVAGMNDDDPSVRFASTCALCMPGSASSDVMNALFDGMKNNERESNWDFRFYFLKD